MISQGCSSLTKVPRKSNGALRNVKAIVYYFFFLFPLASNRCFHHFAVQPRGGTVAGAVCISLAISRMQNSYVSPVAQQGLSAQYVTEFGCAIAAVTASDNDRFEDATEIHQVISKLLSQQTGLRRSSARR
jgi:hypothetical protein